MVESLKIYMEAEEQSKRDVQKLKEKNYIRKMNNMKKQNNMYKNIINYTLFFVGFIVLFMLFMHTFIGGMVTPPEGYEKNYITHIVKDNETMQSISYQYVNSSDIKLRQVDIEHDMVVTNHRYDHIEPGEEILVPVITEIATK